MEKTIVFLEAQFINFCSEQEFIDYAIENNISNTSIHDIFEMFKYQPIKNLVFGEIDKIKKKFREKNYSRVDFYLPYMLEIINSKESIPFKLCIGLNPLDYGYIDQKPFPESTISIWVHEELIPSLDITPRSTLSKNKFPNLLESTIGDIIKNSDELLPIIPGDTDRSQEKRKEVLEKIANIFIKTLCFSTTHTLFKKLPKNIFSSRNKLISIIKVKTKCSEIELLLSANDYGYEEVSKGVFQKK